MRTETVKAAEWRGLAAGALAVVLLELLFIIGGNYGPRWVLLLLASVGAWFLFALGMTLLLIALRHGADRCRRLRPDRRAAGRRTP